MATPAQTIANRSNAQASTGPVTSEGKSRVSRNAVTSGLFSSGDLVLATEQDTYTDFCAAFQTDLAPEGAIENVFAAEIIHAAWRLRRCSVIESNCAASVDSEAIDATQQASVDRARASAHKVFQRGIAELRRIQTERHLRLKLSEQDQQTVNPPVNLGIASCREIDSFLKPVPPSQEDLLQQHLLMRRDPMSLNPLNPNLMRPEANSAKQSQFEPAPQEPLARNAQCSCGSGQKYKRCCGKDAPPVLSHPVRRAA